MSYTEDSQFETEVDTLAETPDPTDAPTAEDTHPCIAIDCSGTMTLTTAPADPSFEYYQCPCGKTLDQRLAHHQWRQKIIGDAARLLGRKYRLINYAFLEDRVKATYDDLVRCGLRATAREIADALTTRPF